ncbi:MAG: helix-turn-helix transcriptional regulator [Gammaproteobacteria bacterium]|nr:helix-turn-helix transcriptional regulator [Gammaproteobacteria bacterium]
MAGHNLARFNEIVNTIYSSRAEIPRWSSFLRNLKEATGSVSAYMAFGDEVSWHERAHFLESASNRAVSDGQDHSDYLRLSPFTPLPQGQVATMSELLRKGESVHPDFFSHVIRPAGIGDIIGVNFARHGKQVATLRLGRMQAAGRYSRRDKDLCALMLPHLQRVCAESAGMNNAPEWQPILFDAVHWLGVGVVLIDACRQIIDASDLAFELMANYRHLFCAGRAGLHFRSLTHEEVFGRAVSRVLGGSESQALRVAGGDHRGGLDFVCVRAPQSVWGAPQRRVVVFVSHHRQPRPVAVGTLRGLFGLSRAEAQVALGLAAGLSISQIGERDSISRNTVYSHLKSAFDKVGVSQQSALVSCVLRSIAVLGRE